MPTTRRIDRTFPAGSTGKIAGVEKGGASKGETLNQEAHAPTFYSQLRKVVDERMPARAKPRDVMNLLGDPQKGVKADELKWTGLDDYLKAKAEKNEAVTKVEVQKFLDENNVQMKEVMKGGKANFLNRLRRK